MAKIRSFPFPFPVADTEGGPVITWRAFDLRLTFTDYLGNDCEAIFREVSHYELLVEDELDSTIYRYDGVVEVVDSPIIQKLVEIGDITKAESRDYQHIVIGFNEIGSYLVVICRTVETKLAEQASDGQA